MLVRLFCSDGFLIFLLGCGLLAVGFCAGALYTIGQL